MFCFHYFIFFYFFNCQILQLNGFDEEHNDIFAELWQKSEEIGTESGKCEETLQNSNDNLISQKIGKIKKEIVVKDEPNDYNDFNAQFSNEKQQKVALNKTVKEENVEKRIKSEFMEFDRISDKEEFDNGKDGEEQNTDSLFDNSNLKKSSSKSQKVKRKNYYTDAEKVELLKNFYKIKKENPQLRNDEISQMLNIQVKTLNRWERKSKVLEPGIKKNYSEVEKQEIIAEFDKLKKLFTIRAKGMSYQMEKIDKIIAQKLGVSNKTIYNWKRQFGASINRMNYTDAEKVELLENFNKIKKENPQLRNDEIAQMLNIHITTLYFWERKSKGLKPGIRKIYSEVKKQELIAEFDHLNNEFKTRTQGMPYDLKKFKEKIVQKLGVSRTTIYRWKKEFGILRHTDAEKIELLKTFYKMKKENPQLHQKEITQMLNIHIKTLNRWERKLKGLKPVGNRGPIDNVQRPDGSERSTSSANSLNDIPWKWNNFRKKRNKRIGKILFKCLNSIP